MIRLDLTGTLMCLPRYGQGTTEGMRESLRRNLENPKLHPDMRDYYERKLGEEMPRIGRFSNGERYTHLRIDHEGRRIEVTAGGNIVDQAAALEPGATLRLRCELTGEDPHYHFRVRKITVIA